MFLNQFRSWLARSFPSARGGRRPTVARRRPAFRPGLEALDERTLLSAGALDPFFSGDGKQAISFDIGGNKFDEARAVAVDKLGRIVVVGAVQVNATSTDFGVIRLNPDGSLDTTFDGDGLQTVAFDVGGLGVDKATAVAIDKQGRIVVAGFAQRVNGDSDFAVARLLDNGKLDFAFDGGGRQTVAFDIGKTLGFTDDVANAVAIDSQGRIVLAGTVQIDQNDFDFGVARLKDDGSLDNSFGIGGNHVGQQIIDFDLGGNNVDQANAVAIDGSDRIVLAGSAERGSGDVDMAVARLNVNGQRDATFDGDGKQTVAFDFGQQKKDVANAVALDGQGRIVLAGFAERGTVGDTDFALARLKDDGSLDDQFGAGGKRTVAFDLGGLDTDKATAVAIQPDGKIVAAGFAQPSFNGLDFALARLNADGSPDATFDGDGKKTVAFDLFGNGTDGANAVALSPDGTRLVVAGEVEAAGGQSDFGVAVLDTGLAPTPTPAPGPGPTPTPTPMPTPTPAARGIVASLAQVKQKGKKVLLVVVRFADTGEVKSIFRSPFQKPAFQKVRVSVVDANVDGVAETILLFGRRNNGKTKLRLIPV